MRTVVICAVLLSAVIVTGLIYTGTARATPAIGFVGTTIALGRFGDIDVFNQATAKSGPNWMSMQKTQGDSDLYVQNNVWQPGGTTGWHSHPGHSLIIVTAGTVTDYESNDPGCKPTVYTKGMGFVDSGGDHVHNIRNESDEVAGTVAIQLIPAGATRRIDAPQPSNCPVFPVTAAVATPKSVTVVSSEVQLDGTKSTSFDGNPLKFQWTIPRGSPSAAMLHGDTPTPSVQFSQGRGLYTFALTVTDSAGVSSTDTATVSFAGN
jgi:hypothetical protein